MKRFCNLMFVIFLLTSILGASPTYAQSIIPQTQAANVSSSTPKAIDTSTPKVSDLTLRKAVAYCTDKAALVRSVYPLLNTAQVNSLLRDSFLPASSPAYHSPVAQYPFSKDVGRSLLLNNSWKLPTGGAFGTDYLVNSQGEELAIKLTTTNSSFRQTWASVWVQQMKECGIRVVPLYTPSSWFFGHTTGLTRRDFEAGAFAWVNSIDPFLDNLYACDQIPTADNAWQGQNDMGWCNSAASDAIKIASHSFSPTARTTQFAIAQDAFGQDVPSLPLFSRPEYYAYANSLTSFNPAEADQYYDGSIHQWAISGRTVINWGFNQEPNSLFGIQDNSWASGLILGAVQGLPYTSGNYNPQPLLQAPFATLENGQALNNTITVNSGDQVVNSSGEVVTLSNGVKVRDASGVIVTFSGSSISMKQLVVPYTYLSNLQWSDGQLVVQADFQLGFNIVCSPDSGNVDYSKCDRTKTIAFNPHGYSVTWLPGYDYQNYFLAPFPYYPAHQVITSPGPYHGQSLGNVPASAWSSLPEVITTPLGAGPYIISAWAKTQYINLSANPYYALGAPVTPSIHIQFISSQNIENALISGTVDLLGPEVLVSPSQALVNASNITKIANPGTTWEHVDFNFDFPPAPSLALDNLAVRQAVAYCTNKQDLLKSVYPTLTDADLSSMVMNSWIPTSHWAYAGDSNLTIYPFQKDVGRSLLLNAGWKLPSGGAFGTDYLVNEKGEELSLKLTTTNSSFRQTWAAVWKSQMKDCGIDIVLFYTPSSWFFGTTTGLAHRDFEVGAFAWVGQADPGGISLYACDQIPTAENGWQGQNDMGWCNPTASTAIKVANNSLLLNVRKQQYAINQAEFTRDEPSIPLFTRPDVYIYNKNLTGLNPGAGEMYYDFNISHWAIPGQSTIQWGLTQQPPTLFGLQTSNWASHLILSAVEGMPYSSVNFAYQPILQASFATLESGLAQNNTVTVNAGDKVLDINSNVVNLANGVTVLDASGNSITFTGAPIQMKKLVVPYTFLSNLEWSDGLPVVQADFQLGYSIACDHNSGAVSYIDCDHVASITFNPHGYIVNWIPGYQSSSYFLAPFPYYPAHRVIASAGTYHGQTLGSVPASAWGSLPEVTQTPMGAGPYQIVVNSDHIELAANPHYALGTPSTPNIDITYTGVPNNALISGAVDLVGMDSLTDVSAAVKNAANLAYKILPGATWEHIDFNLGFTQSKQVSVTAGGGTASISTVTAAGSASVTFSGASGSGLIDIAIHPAYQGTLPTSQSYIWPPFDVSLAGSFSFTQATITLPYDLGQVQSQQLDESTLKLLHLENGAWVDVTTQVDSVNHQVSGSVSSLSPFLISGTKAANQHITIWHQWDGAYLTAIQQYFTQYMASHQDVDITLYKPDDILSALKVAIPAGLGPDIIGWANDAIGNNAQNGYIVDLNQLGVTDSFLASTFEPAAAAGVKWNNKIWALPESIEGIALVYNPALVTAAYLPTDPLNFTDLRNKAAAFKTATGKPLICNQGFPGGDAYHIAPVYFGFGVPGYVDDTGNAYSNTPAAIAAGTWLASMPTLSPSAQDYDTCQAALLAGNVGAWWTGPWAIAGLEANHFNYAILPMGKPFVGIKSLMITSNAVQRGSAAAALDLVKAYTGFDASKALTLTNKTVPANSAALHDPAVQVLPTIAGFGAAISIGIPMSPSLYSGCQWGPMGDAQRAIWSGAQTPTAALNAAQAQILACIRPMKMARKVFLPSLAKQ